MTSGGKILFMMTPNEIRFFCLFFFFLFVLVRDFPLSKSMDGIVYVVVVVIRFRCCCNSRVQSAMV